MYNDAPADAAAALVDAVLMVLLPRGITLSILLVVVLLLPLVMRKQQQHQCVWLLLACSAATGAPACTTANVPDFAVMSS